MELISKKELLAKTGISYGQLYRWKRERLIPEEWFIKQSSYTGQETFFPAEKMLTRIKTIKEMKDSYSLDELAALFKQKEELAVATLDLEKLEWLHKETGALLRAVFEKKEYTGFEIVLADGLLKYRDTHTGIVWDPAKLLQEGIRLFDAKKLKEPVILVVSGDGCMHIVLCEGAYLPLFDDSVKEVYTINIGERLTQLSSTLNNRKS